MGHYRSEMGFEDEDERRAKEEDRIRSNILTNIQADIDKRGIAEVLTDMLMNERRHFKMRGNYDWNPDEFKERFL